MDVVNKETVDQYYSLLIGTLNTHDLLNKPQIYNVDQRSIPPNPRTPKVVCGKPRKFDTIHLVVKGKLQLLLVLMLPVKQFIQWSYTVLYNSTWRGPRKSFLAPSMTSAQMGGSTPNYLKGSLLGTIKKINVVSARPLLLLLDGYSTHYQPHVLFATAHNA